MLIPDHAHRRRQKESRATAYADRYLQHRGSQPRLNQNRLLFLAADADAFAQLRAHTRAFLAWESIVSDTEQLNLDPYHQRQAKENCQTAEGRMMESLLQTYSWLLAPRQELSPKGELLPQIWEEEHLERGGQMFTSNLQQAAIDAEMVIPRWAPVHLRRLLDQFYFDEDRQEIETKRLWDDMARYTYLPRLKDQAVLVATIEAGIQHEDFYGLASGKDDDRYTGLVFSSQGQAYLAEGEVLLSPLTAKASMPKPETSTSPTLTGPATGTSGEPPKSLSTSGGGGSPGGAGTLPQGGTETKTTRFYGATTLNSIGAKGEFSTIMDEVVQHFTAKYGTQVRIRVEIQAEDASGFTDQVQRTVRENCRTLGFGSAEFEE